MAALEMGLAPFVRVPSNTPEYISRVLDGGALGIVAPNVRSAQEARAVVAAAKYPPLGGRGASGALPQLHYRNFPAAEANAALDAATMVIVQFESWEAVDKAEEIVAIEGVDMVLIGVNDLLASLGLAGQFEHDKVREAYARTIAACRKHGKHVGVGGLASRPKLVAEFVKMGARYVSTGTESASCWRKRPSAPKRCRSSSGETPFPFRHPRRRSRCFDGGTRGAGMTLVVAIDQLFAPPCPASPAIHVDGLPSKADLARLPSQ